MATLAIMPNDLLGKCLLAFYQLLTTLLVEGLNAQGENVFPGRQNNDSMKLKIETYLTILGYL